MCCHAPPLANSCALLKLPQQATLHSHPTTCTTTAPPPPPPHTCSRITHVSPNHPNHHPAGVNYLHYYRTDITNAFANATTVPPTLAASWLADCQSDPVLGDLASCPFPLPLSPAPGAPLVPSLNATQVRVH